MRQPSHNYASPGAYFVTICAHQRHLLFEDAAVSDVISSAWTQISQHFPAAHTDTFVVMPNHIHGIIVLRAPGKPLLVGAQHAGRLPTTTREPSAATLSVIIRSFKAAVTRELRLRGLWDEQPFWQRNYYDRVIRDAVELERIREYIAHNPAAWLHDQENPGRLPDEGYKTRWAWLENTLPPSW